MTVDGIVVFVHVLGWVFWLGTDVGVFLAAKFSERTNLSVETRLTVMRLGMLLDIAPRVAVPVVFATGVHLSDRLGYDLLSAALGWAIGGVWLLAVIVGIATQGRTLAGRAAMRLQFTLYAIVFVGMGGVGTAALLGAVDLPFWLALKWLAYAVIAVSAILLEITFKPVVAAYERLGREGASNELNAAISRGLRPVYVSVLVIYTATLVAAYCGLVKPG